MIGGNDEGMDLIDVRSFLLLSYYSKRAYRFRINDWWRRMNKIIIIGCSAAGLSALENLRKYDKQSEVLVLSKEGAPYSRVLLPYILRQKLPYEGLDICGPEYFTRYNAQFKQENVIGVDPEKKTVTTDQATYPYDKLLIATGSYAVAPPIEGMKGDKVFHMWTRSDLDALLPYFETSKRVCVIGSGFVALQAAWAARSRGLDVTVIELMDRIMPNVLDDEGAKILSQRIRECGVALYTGTSTQSIETLEDGSLVLHLKDKEDVPADFVIVGTGVRPNVGFLEGSGIVTDRGIPVDGHMRTNVEDVYASGDVAAGPTIFGDVHLIHALWPTAVEMGKVAGENMAGLSTVYEGSLNMNVTEMYGVTVASIGKFADQEVDDFYLYPSEPYGYLKICCKDGRLIGGCLVGNSDAVEYLGKMRPLIRKGEAIDCRTQDVKDYINKEIFNQVWREGL